MDLQTIIVIIAVVFIGVAALVLRQRYYEAMIRQERELKSGPPVGSAPEPEQPGEVRRHAEGLFPPQAPQSGPAAPGGVPSEAAKQED